ncbi:hypothetical protein E5361_07445 [Histophilus somni]|uniref:hypothetical protein n=1 Tax=Histophilus somni TaxID=731 RepID=UPI00094AD7FD|nr:hypothetical protein [Histophilus somni]THA21155.1 hypothetical protein E5361_07445 [Histophilus somni]
MKMTNDKAKHILASFIRSCGWLNLHNQTKQSHLDLTLINKTRHFLATLNQQSEESWQTLSQQEQHNVISEINLLFSQLSSPFYRQTWEVDENADLASQAISLL